MSIETIKFNEETFALVLRQISTIENTTFFTEKTNPFQLSVQLYKKGYNTRAHIHKSLEKVINIKQEILHIENGNIEVNLYNDEGKKFRDIILSPGDTILLMRGGHGIKMIEDTKIIMIKQGPYSDISTDKKFIDDDND